MLLNPSFDTATFILALTNVFAFLLSLVGALVILWGAAKALRRAFWTEAEPWKGPQVSRLEDVRTAFGHRIILGLEFFLAGELVRLLVDPSQDDLLRVGAIVLIRVVLSTVVTREVRLRVLDLRGRANRARV